MPDNNAVLIKTCFDLIFYSPVALGHPSPPGKRSVELLGCSRRHRHRRWLVIGQCRRLFESNFLVRYRQFPAFIQRCHRQLPERQLTVPDLSEFHEYGQPLASVNARGSDSPGSRVQPLLLLLLPRLFSRLSKHPIERLHLY